MIHLQKTIPFFLPNLNFTLIINLNNFMFFLDFSHFMCTVYYYYKNQCVCSKAIKNSHFYLGGWQKFKLGKTIESFYVKNYTLNYGRMQIKNKKNKRNQRACGG